MKLCEKVKEKSPELASRNVSLEKSQNRHTFDQSPKIIENDRGIDASPIV